MITADDRIYFDEAPCAGFSPATMIDPDFVLVFKAESHISNAVPDEQIFSSLKLYAGGQTFKNGAALFFGKQPEAIFEKAVIRCVAFQGSDKRYIVDDQVFGGY